MARQRRARRKGTRRASFSTIHPAAAGLDVGSRFHVVAVAPERDAEPVRTLVLAPVTVGGRNVSSCKTDTCAMIRLVAQVTSAIPGVTYCTVTS